MAADWLGDSNGPMGDAGAFMDSELRVDRADLAGHVRQLEGTRSLIALVGPAPQAAALAEDLAQALNAAEAGVAAVLEAADLSPADLSARLAALRVPGAETGARHILISGPRLLWLHPDWRDLALVFDLTIRLDLPEGQELRRESRAADLVTSP